MEETFKATACPRIRTAEVKTNPTITLTGCVSDLPPLAIQRGAQGHSAEEELFSTPPEAEECPLCCHAMPAGIWDVGPGVSKDISFFQPCCGKNICRGCIFSVHHPEFKDPQTFVRSLNPVFLEGRGSARAKANEGKDKKKGKGNNKKKGKNKGNKIKSHVPPTPSSSKAEPPSGNFAPVTIEEDVPAPLLESAERTVKLNLNGTISCTSQGVCPFCRSPELKGAVRISTLQSRIDNKNCEGAYYDLGGCHYEGLHGLKQSLKKAKELWEKAASLGSMKAHYALGMFLMRDEMQWKKLGVKDDMTGCKDMERSRYHFAKAAVLGHPDARYNLAYFYAQDGDFYGAFEQYKIAAKQGHTKSLQKLDEVCKQGAIVSISDYEECAASHQGAWKEMGTEQRVLSMRFQKIRYLGVIKSDPLRSFVSAMYQQTFNGLDPIMINGKQEFRFNPVKCEYEEVTDKKDFKFVGRLDADGNPLKKM
jgi:hypothetical protein